MGISIVDDQTEPKSRSQYLDHQALTGDAAFVLSGDHRQSIPPGQLIENRFRIIRELGRGGTGTVYQVEQILLKQQFALKVLDPVQVHDEAWRRFQKEAQAAGRLDHPGFVKVHDFGLIDNTIPFFVMDLVTGETLSARLRRLGPSSVSDALPIFIQLCFALDYAHSKGVIHRDVKPSNIAITEVDGAEGEQIKILDFGIAKLMGVDTTSLTKVGSVFGTPFYMSPEQCKGHSVDNRSDIYSLGCVFFETLTGAPPFTSDNALSTMMQHQSETPLSLKEASVGGKFPETLEAIVRKMLAKSPDDRYQRLIDTANDLIEFQQGKTPPANISKPVKAFVPERKKSNLILTYIAVALTVLLLVAAYLLAKGLQSQVPDVVPSPPKLQTADEKESSENTKYEDFISSERFFSRDAELEGVHGRKFEFPLKASLGKLTYYDYKTHKNVDALAVGNVFIPFVAGYPTIELRANWLMCNTTPQLLGKFRSDEIGSLSFDEGSARRSMADDNIYDNALAFVDDWKEIHSLVLPRPVTNKSITSLAKLPKLVFLDVSSTKLTGAALTNLKSLLNLKILRANDIKGANVLLPPLKHSKKLEQIFLISNNLQNRDLASLSGVTTLTEVVLRNNPKITDDGLKYLVNLPNLHRLALDGCNITPRALKYLRKLKMKGPKAYISLDLSKWSEADIATLKSLPFQVKEWTEQLAKHSAIEDAKSGKDEDEDRE
jgi:serine/threonine protein kinase